jgi:hypothetical protein
VSQGCPKQYTFYFEAKAIVFRINNNPKKKYPTLPSLSPIDRTPMPINIKAKIPDIPIHILHKILINIILISSNFVHNLIFTIAEWDQIDPVFPNL